MLKQRRLKGLQQDGSDITLPPNPLDIPELIELVGCCLDRHSLTICVRVCRQWHRVLLSHVWQVVKMHLGECSPLDPLKSNGPSLPLFSEYSEFVRRLALCLHTREVEFPGQRSVLCPWLTELTVVTTGFQDLNITISFLEESLPAFIARHRGTLKKLVLRVNQSRALTDAVRGCSCLESLTSSDLYLGDDNGLDGWMDWYKSQGSRLKSLSFIGPRVRSFRVTIITAQDVNLFLLGVPESSLQSLELKLGYSIRTALLLVMKSPELRRLTWPGFRTISQLAEVIKNSPPGVFLQKLESLSMPFETNFSTEDFKRVMEYLPALTDLTMTALGFIYGPISHCLTALNLQKLSIRRCPWATSEVVQRVLCSMPTLEVLAADFLTDNAIEMDPRPWVCKGLRNLTIVFPLISGTTSHAMILDRLCQLERLEMLVFFKDILFRGGKDYLHFRLESDLDKLKTLKRLQVVEAHGTQLPWEEPEARWALENWVQLKEIDIKTDDKARQLLGHRLRVKKDTAYCYH